VQVSEAGKVSATLALLTLLGPALLAVIVYVVDPPAETVVTPSVFVMARSALASSVSVSVAELLPGVGSGVLAETVAVLERLPLAAPEIAQFPVYVTLPPLGRFTVSLILPEPEAVQVPPPAPRHVQVQVSEAGNVSATVAPLTLLGPALLAVIVYVVDPPGVAVVTPSVFVMARSALPPTVSVSVAELLAGFGSVVPPDATTVAVLLMDPLAAPEIVQLAV
jgi:hypothetical protein